jgi:hypothetical protein
LKVQENFTLRGWILSIEQRIIESFSNNKWLKTYNKVWEVSLPKN